MKHSLLLIASLAAAGYGSPAVSLSFLFSRNLLSDAFLAMGMSEETCTQQTLSARCRKH